ncbi:sarcalumenin [Planococcus citri]|uniref:sarcalumenin n=1 Tax=Planococcus citri TaxID=170843 RepID=UPI0031F7B850
MSAGKGSIFILLLVGAIIGTFFGISATESNNGEIWAKALPQVVPSENECRPYIEKAIKQLTTDGSADGHINDNDDNSTDENKDEGPAASPDAENLPDDSADSTDQQSEETQAGTEEESKTPVVEVSEISEDGEEILVPNEDSNDNQNEKPDESEPQESAEAANTSAESKSTSNEESSKESEENKVAEEPNVENATETKESSESIKEPAVNAVDLNEEGQTEDETKSEEDTDSKKTNVEEKNSKEDEKSATVEDTNDAASEEEKSNDEITDDDDKNSNENNDDDDDDDSMPEEELIKDREIPKKLRNRDHIDTTLQIEKEESAASDKLKKLTDTTLKELKRLYENAIKPMEVLYKYRDLSNRHFGDPEIFSKPLVLFMGPWSGGKSTIINYLLDNEFSDTALRSGAEPSPAYFNILMWGENDTVLDGTQLAADWTFSGLQKFGQGLLDRLKGLQIARPLLEKVNIVEIPGILEIRKQVERMFPFNDACQWFIDRADIIFLVYDPSKLDVGPETEAILDQLKGREYQTRILLNKADQVKAEELMRVQGTLVWNISPLMSSIEPPIMYSTSLWSLPYEKGSPAKLLHAQEVAFLKDLRTAIEKRVENKISSARRFAVRVRNHAKMVDCYLTTYYNHKSFFANKKKINDDIIEHPQNYHIYEGLSTLTNISRYDLPDPAVYKDFFRLHPIYEFQRLSDTCTYFRGCPINRLDIAIAYDLPELVGKYKKSVESILNSNDTVVKKT